MADAGRRRAAAAPQARAARAERARAAQGGRPHPRRAQPGRAGRQRRDPRGRRAGAARVRPRRPASPWPRRSWARALLDSPTTRARSARSASSRATTRWPASTRPTWCIAIGYDLVEHSPEHWNPGATRRSSASTRVPAEIDEYFMPEVELVGDIYHILARLAEECRHVPHSGGSHAPARRRARPLRGGQGRRRSSRCSRRARCSRSARRSGREDILVSDVGLHKLWIGRMFPALRAEHRADRQRPGGHGLRGAGGDRGEARAPRPQGRGGQRRRRLPDELPGARDRGAAEDAVRERDLGEPPVRLDRLEAGQEVRPPLRRRLHEPRLRPAGRVLRDAGLALRVGRGLRPAPAPRADARPARR